MWALINTQYGLFAVWNPSVFRNEYGSQIGYDECFIVYDGSISGGYLKDARFGNAPFHSKEILSFELI